jgi:predicted  nucleic acid-binding Zn-ribbon protein
MKRDKNIYQALSRKITINLAQHQDLKRQYEVLKDHNLLLESKISQLMKEVKALTDENSDLKEIVFALNQENEDFRQTARE